MGIPFAIVTKYIPIITYFEKHFQVFVKKHETTQHFTWQAVKL